MLEKQEGAARAADRGEDEAHRLPTSLSGEINTATRTLHTTLNRLITSRLPLALPPHTPDPTLYTTGLLHFAHIFLTFESLWADLLRDHPTHPSREEDSTSPLLSYLLVNPYDAPAPFTHTPGAATRPSPQLLAFLATLRPAGLPRSSRLKTDLAALLQVHPTDLDVLLSTYPSPAVEHFCTHIRRSVHKRPWVLVAYAWCFYMAVFSGGRWIRHVLVSAPEGFWPDDVVQQGLSFWHFDGLEDGLDIKNSFKERLEGAEMEDVLSVEMRVDVIEEARRIFEFCAGLVAGLDGLVGTDLGALEAAGKLEREKHALPSTEGMGKMPSQRMWKRPEVVGTVFAVGCLACWVWRW